MIDLWGKRAKVSEAEVMRVVARYLEARRVFFWRNNSGAYRDQDRFIKYGFKGSPDFLAVFPGDKNGQGKGKLWCIEAKAPKGRLSDGQIAFLRGARHAGAVVSVAEGIDDVDLQLSRWDAPVQPRYEAALDK